MSISEDYIETLGDDAAEEADAVEPVGYAAAAAAPPAPPTRPVNPPPPPDTPRMMPRPVVPDSAPSEAEFRAALLRGLAAVNTKLERLVQAVETQNARAAYAPPRTANGAPAQQGGPAMWICPVHGSSKLVPAGTSRRTGKPYPAFYACDVDGCPEKPPR